MPRTTVSWKNHQLNIEESDWVTIHELRQGDLKEHRVTFTNTKEVLVVTGDFGMWTFCRPFIPHITNEVIFGGYWLEKLEAAHQSQSKIGTKYCPIETSKAIDERIKEIIYEVKGHFKQMGVKLPSEETLEEEYYGSFVTWLDSIEWDDELIHDELEEIQYLVEIQEDVEDELDYTYRAYREKPEHVDYDEVIFQRIAHPQLEVVFDAFEEICRRLSIRPVLDDLKAMGAIEKEADSIITYFNPNLENF